jgi:hypothetical protein
MTRQVLLESKREYHGCGAYPATGENVRTISYMPGSNFAIVSTASRKGSVPESRLMAVASVKKEF